MIKYNRVQYNKVTRTIVNEMSEKNEEHLRRLDKAMDLICDMWSDEEILRDDFVSGKINQLLDTCRELKLLLQNM